MEKIATLLGKRDDAAKYAELAKQEKDAFNARFFDAAKGCYDKGSQTAQAMPLALGIVPDDERAAVLEHMVADIRAHEDHVTAGEIGFPYVVRALMESGRSDVLMAMLLRKDPPSYGSQLAAGATALTEAWDANPRAAGPLHAGRCRGVVLSRAGRDRYRFVASEARADDGSSELVDGLDWVKCFL